MRIALISGRADPYIPPVDVHGGTVLMLNLINALLEEGHNVDVFTRLDKNDGSQDEFRRNRAKRQIEEGGAYRQIKGGLQLFRLPYRSLGREPNVWQKQVEESASFLDNVRDYLDKNEYDVLHYFHLASIVGWLYTDNREIPYIGKSTFSPLFLSVGRKFEQLSGERIFDEKKVLGSLKAVSCVSQGEVDTIKEEYSVDSSKLYSIPLGVDTSIYYPKNTYPATCSTRPILVCPNSIKPQKRQLDMIKIAARLKTKGYKPLVAFIGTIIDLDYYTDMLSLMDKEGFSYSQLETKGFKSSFNQTPSDVLFIPNLDEKALAEYVRASDLAVFPSTDESFSLLNLNCMACGTLPVCSNIKEYSDYLKPGENAIAVDVSRGWVGFADEIDLLLSDWKRLVELSKKSASLAHKFSWTTLMEKQLLVYEGLRKNK